MFKRIKLRIRDIGTINALCSGAEKQAHENGEAFPGAEHFLLAAMALPDGTARRAFERVGADPDTLRAAIAKQYSDALNRMGIDLTAMDTEHHIPEPVTSNRMLYDTKPSGQAVMKALYEQRTENKNIPLLGAHVVAVIASMEQGVAARSLLTMGIDQNALGAAAKQTLNAFSRKQT